jgi:REP element-mobilizing transposase RayT
MADDQLPHPPELSEQFTKPSRPEKVAEPSRLSAPEKVAEPSRLSPSEHPQTNQTPDASTTPINYFDPDAPIAFLSGDLPHWRQDRTTYFVTFRLADALPQEKLWQWQTERQQWLKDHPEPHDEITRRDYFERFPQRLQIWLDSGMGSCVLSLPQVKTLVQNALRYFEGERYRLHEFVVAPNHVHAILTPLMGHILSDILHSWKSYTAHEILKVAEASRLILLQKVAEPSRLSSPEKVAEPSRLSPSEKVAEASRLSSPEKVAEPSRLSPSEKVAEPSRLSPSEKVAEASRLSKTQVWQKESFDHIVRSPQSLAKFRAYIRNHIGYTGHSDC